MKSLAILLEAKPMNLRLVTLCFAFSYALLLGSAFAQPTQTVAAIAVGATVPDQMQSVAGARRDDAQDALARLEAAKLATIEAEMRRAKEQLAIQQASNAFWLQVLQTVMTVLSPIGIALVAYLQVRANRERKLMAQSINGMKTELVANTRAAAYHEGAMLEREKNNPDTPSVIARGQQLADEARAASEKAQQLAAIAAGEKPSPLIGQSPAAAPSGLATDTVVLKPGDEVTVAAEDKPPKV